MEKKLTNNGPLKELADKHSIYTIQLDKKREQTLREHRRGRWEGVDGYISHQLVLCLVQPVDECGMAGGPIIRGHRAAFLSDLEIVTCLQWRLASASGCKTVAREGSRSVPNVPQSPVNGLYSDTDMSMLSNPKAYGRIHNHYPLSLATVNPRFSMCTFVQCTPVTL